MRWADIDFDLKRCRISETQTKNKEVNVVLLLEQAVILLKEQQEANKKAKKLSVYVFPGDSAEKHLNDPKRCFDRIKVRMDVGDIRIHDLRQTLASYMAINGASLPIIGSALNHRSQESTKIYARLSQRPVLEAINQATDTIFWW